VNAEGDGIRAIERVVREGFDAVASDIEMPEIKGFELL
jgi:CheY-like chemotaxis protein